MQKRAYLALAILSPLFIIAVWAYVTYAGLIRPIILPAPERVFNAFIEMVQRGYSGVPLLEHFWASLYRVGIAFLGGAFLGIVFGLIRGRTPWVDAILLVPAEVIRPIPPIGLIPIFILWFGIGELSKILLIGVTVFLIMMVNTQEGTRSVAPDMLRAGQTCGASRFQIFRFVILPSALPQIMTGLRISLSMGLSILVAAELLGGDRGLGFIVLDAANFFRTSHVFAGVILIGLLGLFSDRLITFITRRTVHWEGRR
jgi:taurine transport system permease protein